MSHPARGRRRRTGSHPAGALVAVLLGAMLVCAAPAARAQASPPPAARATADGILPDAVFETSFRKYTLSDNAFSPYYSWDATMGLDVTAVRSGANAVAFGAVFQTVGTQNVTSRVSVGGTGYLLRLAYVRRWSDRVLLSAGINHLSSHLTRDLDDKTDEQRAAGVPIPKVADSSEYNIFFVGGQWRSPGWPLAPQIEVTFHPHNFRFDGSRGRYVRPLYLRTRAILWRGTGKAVALETQHEVGRRPFNYVTVSYELAPAHQPEGRLQLFVGVSPGHDVHVSPNVAGLRDGFTLGVRLRFRATP